VPKTLTPAATDRSMWRRLLARTHPDAGGDGDLFVWARTLQENVCGGALEEGHSTTKKRSPTKEKRRRRSQEETSRVPFEAAFEKAESFTDLTAQAVAMAQTVDPIYGRLLRLLEDCEEVAEDHQQNQGSTYKQLAYAAHLAGLDSSQRWQWYKVARSVPLAAKHAGHIIGKLKESA
jgi:hypothetical protein